MSKIEDLREFVNELKDNPCTDCGVEYHPCMMDFDHIGEFKKTMSISQMVTRGLSVERILKEIEKCELVCSNCHRFRTFLRHEAKQGRFNEWCY